MEIKNLQVKRNGASDQTEWVIIGRYVLDILFAKRHARDIDVAYVKTGRRPMMQEILAWVSAKSFHTTRNNPDLHPVTDLFRPEVGGLPCFNIDYWQLHRDGRVYQSNPDKAEYTKLTIESAVPLRIVHPENLTKECARRGLERMINYPELHEDKTKTDLNDFLTWSTNTEP